MCSGLFERGMLRGRCGGKEGERGVPAIYPPSQSHS